MGIQGLWDVIGEGSLESIAAISSEHFQRTGRPFRIAIDEASWRFHNLDDLKIAQIREREPRANPKEKAIFHRVIALLQLHVELLFVFDGPRRPWKRGRPCNGMKEQYQRIELLVKTLDVLKIPHHRAPGEAEAECAKLQQEGIVDAVWSEDGDTLMFGCDYLLRTYRESKNVKSKTHVRVHKASEIRTRRRLDQHGLVLLAILCGGDYAKGLKGCGAWLALKVARKGFGKELCDALDAYDTHVWRTRLESFLRSTARGSTLDIPPDFPNSKALKNYKNPVVSSSSELVHFLDKPTHQWGRAIDEDDLKAFLAETYIITDALYRKHMDPIFFIRAMAASQPGDQESNRVWGVRVVKSKKALDSTQPTLKVKFRSRDAQKYGEDGDKAQDVVECEVPEYLLLRGLPTDVLDGTGSTSAGRKRMSKKRDSPSPGNSEAQPKSKSPSNASQESKTSTNSNCAISTKRKGQNHLETTSRKARKRQSLSKLPEPPIPDSSTVIEPLYIDSEDEDQLPELSSLLHAGSKAQAGRCLSRPAASSIPPTQGPEMAHSDYHISYTDSEDEETALKGAVEASMDPSQCRTSTQDVEDEQIALALSVSLDTPTSSASYDPSKIAETRLFSADQDDDDAEIKAALEASLHDNSTYNSIAFKGPMCSGEVIDLCDD